MKPLIRDLSRREAPIRFALGHEEVQTTVLVADIVDDFILGH